MSFAGAAIMVDADGGGPASVVPAAGDAAASSGAVHGEAALAYPVRDLQASKLARTLKVLLRKPQPRVRRFVAGPASVDPPRPPAEAKARAPRRSTPPDSSFGHKTGHQPAADIPTYEPAGECPWLVLRRSAGNFRAAGLVPSFCCDPGMLSHAR